MGKYDNLLDSQQRTIHPLFVSSYIPRKCGIATFTKDLTTAMNDLNPDGIVQIAAIDEGAELFDYPEEVKAHILQYEPDTYEAAARFANESEADIICLQHEYGLYAGKEEAEWPGQNVLRFLRNVDKPVVTTLHTILENPGPVHRDVLLEVIELSDIVVSMMPNAKERLEASYGANPDRLVIIHHGVADRPRAKKTNKKKFNWDGRKVLLMSGLLSDGKGVEYIIQALPEIVKHCPEALFVLVGQTHPDILKKRGERYRESLMKMARDLGVEEHIQMVNAYLPLDELLEYYEACDIYLTPHLDPQQVASGTLAYALGMGKACISTPYIYAQDMLQNGRGILVGFKNSDDIAAAAIKVFEDPSYQADLERKAYALGRKMSWPRVAERYLNLFRLTLEAEERVKAATQ
jgi:glycosyltransferase involved in cell wall biosynthesis